MKVRVVILVTVKYHQNISNCFQVIERTRKCLQTDLRTYGRTDGQTDAMLIAISPEPFGRGIKRTGAAPFHFFIMGDVFRDLEFINKNHIQLKFSESVSLLKRGWD